MYVGCPGTQWDGTIQPVKTSPKIFCQNKRYREHEFVAKFCLLARMPKNGEKKVFHMNSSARNFKLKICKFNILGQRQIIQLVPVYLDNLGDFVSI